VTGTKLGQARAGILELSAYHVTVPWAGQRLRTARVRRGWTQEQLRQALGELAPDRKPPSKTSIVGWEADTEPQAYWATYLGELFDDLDEEQHAVKPKPDTPVEVDLSQVDDLHLLAEVALRMAGGHRGSTGPLPSPRLRWSRADLPSTRRAAELAQDGPDNKDVQA
jgi:transcriptional regulator with XRE-family HTH domain